MDEPDEPTLEDLEQSRAEIKKTLEWLDKLIDDKKKEELCR